MGFPGHQPKRFRNMGRWPAQADQSAGVQIGGNAQIMQRRRSDAFQGEQPHEFDVMNLADHLGLS